MARGINKVILIGNLGQDPESRSTPGGTTVTNLRIATSESWRDKQSGEMKEQTEWHTVVCWNRLGEIAAEYLRKGSQVYIEGRIRTRQWQDQQGQKRYSTEIVATNMQLIAGRSDRPAEDVGATVPPDDHAASDFGGGPDDDIPF